MGALLLVMNTAPIPVLIIGAGPAGIGCALALNACGIQAQIVDAQGIGGSFKKWPRQMRLITPSFHSNSFGCVDLNALTPQTSCADFLHTEHPTGEEYARYLQALVIHYQLLVDAPTKVLKITPLADATFEVQTHQGSYTAEHVIWAAGEFGRPDDGGIRGADLCLHNSKVQDWDQVALQRQKFAIIGGYESGIDAVVNLMQRGKEVHVLSRGEPWGSENPDPSRSLSPRTHDRLKKALTQAPGQVRFYKNAHIQEVRKTSGGYELLDDEQTPFHSPTPPILATGFRHALEPIHDLWSWKKGLPLISEEADESTLLPGLFYSGPSLSHRGMLFCFIYKFRARFGIIARTIAERLGHEWEKPLKLWKERGFMMDDLSCCLDCQCAVEAEETNNPEVENYEAVVA
jgi:cation diffusion facilitator CzcD-associated flavoprotein CzcO